MKTFEIYFHDLNDDAKNRLCEAVGIKDPEDVSWQLDILPLASYDFEENQ